MTHAPLVQLRPDLVGIPVRSPTLPPATHTNTWVIGVERLTVVDPASPWPDQQAHLLQTLRGLGQVERIVLTHHHHDHVSGAGALAEATRAPILAHPLTRERLTIGAAALPMQTFEAGGRRVTPHHTPGHAPGHVVLQLDTGELIAGDMVAGIGTIAIDPDDDGDLGAYLDSLDYLAALGPSALLPAHGPVLTAPAEVLAHYRSHRLARSEQVCDALATQPAATPAELVVHIYPELDPRLRPLAAKQVRAHLAHLAGQGRVTSDATGRWCLRAATG